MPRLRNRVGKGAGNGRTTAKKSPSAAARTDITPKTGGGHKPNAVSDVEAPKRNVCENMTSATKRLSPTVPEENGKVVKKQRTKFPDRLHWKMLYSKMPTTSTPKRDPRTQKVTKYDIDTAFGFDDSCEDVADYSTLVSPIAHASPKGIIPPLWKVHPLTQRNVDCDPPVATIKQRPHHLKNRAGVGNQERRSPRLHKPGKAIVIPISRPHTPITYSKKADLDAPPEDDSVIITGPAEEPLTKDPASSADSAEKDNTSTKQKEEQTITDNPTEVKKRANGGGKLRKQVNHPYHTEKNIEKSSSQRPVRLTRSKAASVIPEKSNILESSPVTQPLRRSKRTATTSHPSGKQKQKVTTPPVTVVEEGVPIEEDEEFSVIPEKSSKLKQRSKNTVVNKNSNAASASVKAKPTVMKTVPLYLEKKQYLLEKKQDDDDKTHQTGTSPFSQLLHRLHEEAPGEKAQGDDDLHVDPKKVIKTYSSRKRIQLLEVRDPETEYDFIPKPNVDEQVVIVHSKAKLKNKDNQQSKKKKRAVTKTKKLKDDDLDEELKKWLDEKNKEFEEVEKTKLVIEQSFSD